MNSFENQQQSKRESLNDRIVGEGTEALNELDGQFPRLIPSLEALTDPSITRGEYFSIIEEFNASNMAEKEGSYQTIHIRGDHGYIDVKYYKNGSTSISGSWS